MVGDPDEIYVESFDIDDINQEHLGEHDVGPHEIEQVRLNGPMFFRNLPGRAGSHIMIGRDDRGRVLYVAMIESPVSGRWRPITAWESRVARKLYGDGR